VLVPDLPGFGLSGKPDRIYSVEDHSRLLSAWLDSLAERGLCVIGNSFGCQVAVDLAVRRPDLVGALVLVGPTTDPAARSMARQALRWAYDLVFEDKKQAAILAADVSDAGIRRVIGTLRMSVRDRIHEKLPSVSVPTVFVRGARDRIVPARWLAEAAARTPAARTLTIPRAAHNAVTTAGAEVASICLRHDGCDGDDRGQIESSEGRAQARPGRLRGGHVRRRSAGVAARPLGRRNDDRPANG
jgi:pimeloyl-ACP methyl ester carboxylesterase